MMNHQKKESIILCLNFLKEVLKNKNNPSKIKLVKIFLDDTKAIK
jgi:hypothetical protein